MADAPNSGPNDSRRPDARRELAQELAERLADGELRTARLIQLLGVAEPPPPAGDAARPANESPIDNATPRPISIWQPTDRGGRLVFERPEPNPLGDHFAVRRCIEAAKPAGTRRLIFLGESAAAGYLYAPHLTPAGELQRWLDAPDAGRWEVVDLARTNETLAGLAATAEAAVQLDPDIWMVFAGNNWDLLETPEVSPWSPSVEARQRYALALRQTGLAGPVELARRRLRARVTETFERLAAAAGDRPVLLVEPPVNLLEWPARQPVPWLAGDGSARWHRHLAAAQVHLAAARWAEAETEAAAMLALEGAERRGGLTPTAYRVRARAALGRGDRAAALRAARAEVDAERYPLLGQLAAPRAGGEARKALREAAERHGFRTIDLDDELAGDSASFLDYCHLSRQAIGTLAGALGREVLGRTAEAAPPPISPEAEATALLGAAVHTAHRLAAPDKRQRLAAWCRAALDASPGAARKMLDLAAVRAVRAATGCPEVWTAEQQRELDRAVPLQLQHGWRWDHLDADLLLAMHDALASRGCGDEAAELLRTVVARCAVATEPIDLAASVWLWEPLERFLPDALARPEVDGRAMLRAPWPTTGFCLVTDGEGAVEIEPVIRLPPIPGAETAGLPPRAGNVGIRLDGKPVGEIAATEHWRRTAVRLPADRLPAGLHRLDLVWPDLPAAGDAARAGILDRLERGIDADLHPVFGEVFSLRARALTATTDADAG